MFSHQWQLTILRSTQSQTGHEVVAYMDVAREGDDVGGGVEGQPECADDGVDWFVGDDIGSYKRSPVDSLKRG